jgi:hypothetical protein
MSQPPVNTEFNKAFLNGIREGSEKDVVILSPANGVVKRRMIYLDNYGGPAMWRKIKEGLVPPHHLRGALELAKMGYEVALPEPLDDFYWRRKPFPHDLRLLKMAREWLGKDAVIFCGHNVLFWLPFLRGLGLLKCKIVSNLWAREPLNLSRCHSGIVGLTGAGADQARKLAPNVKVVQLGWGVHLDSFPLLPYIPERFFSCGIALRDFRTMSLAARRTREPIEVICPGEVKDVSWPENVTVVDGGRGWNTENKKITFQELLHNHYAKSAGSLIIVKEDPREYIACGFTELIEVMAMARPVILTRTGALPTEIDIERIGCGIFVPPDDPGAITEAIKYVRENPEKAEAMGQAGRRACETYYNIDRYAADLDKLFDCI